MNGFLYKYVFKLINRYVILMESLIDVKQLAYLLVFLKKCTFIAIKIEPNIMEMRLKVNYI